MSLNRDLRFGQDDPLEWPQLFHPELPHLACLPKPWRLPSHNSLAIMWDIPGDDDFKDEATSFKGLHGLKHSRFREMVRLIAGLLSKCWPPRVINGMPLIGELRAILDNFLFSVEFSQKDPQRMRLYIRETQRTFLELRACLDYVKHYKSAMEIGTEEGIFGTLSNVRGAITFDPEICKSLYRAHIPVWLIRPSTALESMCIQTVADVQSYYTPHGLETWPLQSPIFVGQEASLEKYVALRQHIRFLCTIP